MNQKTDAKKNAEALEESLEESKLQAGIEELKRDMRSAKVIDWVQTNQKMLTMVAVAVVGGLIAGSMWLEHVKTERASAASMYESAVLEQDKSKQQTLLSDVARDYRGTSYAAMAQMLLARLDTANAEKHLQAIITSSKAMDAWKWQARLDLAELYLENKDAAKAAAVLADPVGPAYEQLRQYLLAKSSSDAAARKDHLQKALDAQSYDADLKQKIERMLADSAS